MFDRNLPEFPFEIDWDPDPMYCLTDLHYTRTTIFTSKGNGLNGFDHLHNDEIEFITRSSATERMMLGSFVSVEFTYLLGRGI